MPLGAHSLARAFVRAGWDVGFVSNPLSPPELLKGAKAFMRRARLMHFEGRWHENGRVWAFTPTALLAPHNAPLLRSRALHRHWQSLTIPGVRGAAERAGFGAVDLLYIDSPVQSFWLDAVRYGRSVARIVDMYSGFGGTAAEVLEMEKELVQRVDLVAATSQPVVKHVDSVGARRTSYLPNGVDFEQFARAGQAKPSDLQEITGPVVLYVGQLRERLDWPLVEHLSSAMPDVSFVFVGPGGAPDWVARVHNVYHLGWKAPDFIPALIAASDVGFIPLDMERYRAKVDAIHPLKLYQYLAAGLPVVAKRTTELRYMQSPAYLYATPDECEHELRRALSGVFDRDAGVEYARAADWDNRLATLLEALGLSQGAPA